MQNLWRINTRALGSRRRAVTALDLTISVLIMGLMAAVALPRFAASLDAMRVRAAAQQIAADMNRARATAIRQSETCTASFTNSPAAYTLVGVKALNGAATYREVTLADFGFSGSLTASFDGATELKWNLHGQPVVGETLDPLVAGSVIVAGGGTSQTVTIDPDTGKADWQ